MNTEQIQYLVLFGAGILVIWGLIWHEDRDLAKALAYGGVVGGLCLVAIVVIARASGG